MATLQHVAEQIKTHHGDRWLFDFLHSPSSLRGNLLLLAAMNNNHAGKPDDAIVAARQAYAEYARVNNKAGAIRSEFERIYALRRKAEAMECIRRGSSIRQTSSQMDYRWVHIQSTIEEASCEAMRNRADAARALAVDANKMAALSKYTTLQLRALGLSGNLDMVEGNSEGTWVKDANGLRQFWNGAYPEDRAFQFYYNLEVDSQKNHRIYLASALQRETLEMIAGRSRFDFEAMAHIRMADAAAAVGDDITARREIVSSRDVLARLPASPAQRMYEAYCEITLARLAVQSGRLEEARELLEKANVSVSHGGSSLLLLEFLSQRRELDEAGSDLAAEQDDLREILAIADQGFGNLKSPGDRWRWRQVVEGAYRRLLEIEVSNPHSESHALGFWLALHEMESAPSISHFVDSRAPEVELLGRARISRLKDRTLVSFSVLPSKLVAWVADDRGIREFALDVRMQDLRKEVRRFYSLCSDPHSDSQKVTRSGFRLYKLLIAPLQAALSSDRVWEIQSDGFLSLIPWAALTTSDGRYLGQEQTIAIFAGFGPTPAKRRSHGVVKTVLAANPESLTLNGHVFPSLPQADGEIGELAHLYETTVILRGKDVTVSNLLRQLPNSGIFEFAGHAVTREHGGELVIHGNGGGDTLTASSISTLQLRNTQLVVLGACSTAAEGDADRDPNGLLRAFLNAGASEALAGRWDLDSGATAGLLMEFHRFFKSDMLGAQSLRAAREKLRSKQRFSHPYYWAGMEIFTAN